MLWISTVNFTSSWTAQNPFHSPSQKRKWSHITPKEMTASICPFTLEWDALFHFFPLCFIVKLTYSLYQTMCISMDGCDMNLYTGYLRIWLFAMSSYIIKNSVSPSLLNDLLFSHLFIYLLFHVSVGVGGWVDELMLWHACEDQRTTYMSHFSLSTMWAPGIEPGGYLVAPQLPY